MAVSVRVQSEAFDAGIEIATVSRGRPEVGAVASFVGLVRDTNRVGDDDERVDALVLEHYPGMTERSLQAIGDDAAARWSLADLVIVHRIGRLVPTDPIVLVAASAPHRDDAFDACRYVMDVLKTEAPFWKKEATPNGERWVEARTSDADAVARWSGAGLEADGAANVAADIDSTAAPA